MTATIAWRQFDLLRTLSAKAAEDHMGNGAPELVNFHFGETGALTKRGGMTRYNKTGIAEKPIHSLYRYYRRGAAGLLLAGCGSALCVGDDATGAFTAIHDDLTEGTPIQFITWANRAIAVNGAEPPIEYDGTIPAARPESAPTATEGAAGVLGPGDYSYRVAFRVGAEESVAGPASEPITIAESKKIELSDIPLGAAEVTARAIYRTPKNGGGTSHLLLTVIADNETTVFSDNTADADLGGAYRAQIARDLGYDTPGACTGEQGEAGQLPAGSYSYRVSFLYATGESNAGEPSNDVNIADNKRIALSRIPRGGAGRGVIARKIYRTPKNGGPLTHRHLVTIEDNSTTTYDDNTPDADLGVEYISDQGRPPTAALALEWRGHIFMAGDPESASRLYWSEALDPNVFHANDYLDLAPDDGDRITALARQQDALVIFKRKRMYILHGPSPEESRVDALTDALGALSARGVVSAEQGLFFLSGQGVAVYDGSPPKVISDVVERILLGIPALSAGNVAAACWKRRIYWAHEDAESGAGHNDRVLVFDLSTNAWTRYEGWNVASWAAWDGEGDQGELYAGAADDAGLVYQMEEGKTDDGSGIACRIAWPYQDLGAAEVWKRLRRVDAESWTPDGGQFVCELATDWGDEAAAVAFQAGKPPAAGTNWGEANWGDFDWAAAERRFSRRRFRSALPMGLRGRRFRVVCRQEGAERFTLYGLILHYLPLRRP